MYICRCHCLNMQIALSWLSSSQLIWPGSIAQQSRSQLISFWPRAFLLPPAPPPPRKTQILIKIRCGCRIMTKSRKKRDLFRSSAGHSLHILLIIIESHLLLLLLWFAGLFLLLSRFWAKPKICSEMLIYPAYFIVGSVAKYIYSLSHSNSNSPSLSLTQFLLHFLTLKFTRPG